MIVTLTVNPALDVYTTTAHLEPDIKMRCAKATRDPGGGGVNVSRVIKRLGGSSTAIYTRGGFTGDFFEKLLDAEQIDQDVISIKDEIRQNFAITETTSGKLFRFGFPGPHISNLEKNKIFQKIDLYDKADYLVGSGSLPPGLPDNFYAKVAAKARKNSTRFILDTSGKAYKGVLDEGVFLLKPNLNELEDLVGQKANDDKEREALLLDVLDKYKVEVLVLSQGAKGALLTTKNKVQHFPAPQVEHISSIGAGDSMVAGMVHALSIGEPVEKAVLFGISCGSATIKSPGTELLQKKDVDELYQKLLQEVAV